MRAADFLFAVYKTKYIKIKVIADIYRRYSEEN